MRGIVRSVRRNIVTGFLLIIPLVASLYVIVKAFQLVDSVLPVFIRSMANMLPETWRVRIIAIELVDNWIPGVGIVIILLACFILGAAARNFFGHKLISTGNAIIARIPFFNKIYVGMKQILDAVVSNKKKLFQRVVLVEYPRQGCYVMGFMTAHTSGAVADTLGKETVTVFVPFSPTLTHGLLLHMAESSLIDLDMNVETALKHLVSAGIFSSEQAAAGGERYQLPRSLRNWNWLRSLMRREESGHHDPKD